MSCRNGSQDTITLGTFFTNFFINYGSNRPEKLGAFLDYFTVHVPLLNV